MRALAALAAAARRPRAPCRFLSSSAAAASASEAPPRERLDFDVVVVGAGPAGLAAALRLKKRAADADAPLSVAVVDKAAAPGAHTLSGAVIDPRGLTELLGEEWVADAGDAAGVAATRDRFYYLTAGGAALRLPTPPPMRSVKSGCRVVSLSELVRWLAAKAEAAGVDVLPGFAAADVLTDPATGAVTGVVTGDAGVGKDGTPRGGGGGGGFQPGVELRARATLLAEGCRGSVTERVIERFSLRAKAGAQHQTYALGMKEVWSVDAAQHAPGTVWHTIGHPLDARTYGGGFLYHMGGEGHRVSVGLIVGLDYPDPSLNLYQEFQRFKAHPAVRRVLEGGSPRAYGARTLNEGGWQSLPALSFPGGALLGCGAGTLVVPRLKGTHTAVKSGALAADAAFDALAAARAAGREAGPLDLSRYDTALRESWVGDELQRARNVRPGFKHGLWPGLAAAAVDTLLLRGAAPWTLRHGPPDRAATRPAADTPSSPRPPYPPPDGVVTFALPDALARSGTDHEPDQPCHLTLKNPGVPAVLTAPVYGGPEARFCPAGVYEYYDVEAGAASAALSHDETVAKGVEGTARLRINAQNCLHCKACDIKDPANNIVWTAPEGGGGPAYTET